MLRTDIPLLRLTRHTWEAAAPLRQQRARAKRFTFGDQLSEIITTPSSPNPVTERLALLNEGIRPITNNIIRQMVRSIVGRYRYLNRHNKNNPSLLDTDARALEEYLISGIIFQHLNPLDNTLHNISPDRLICSTCLRPDASDATTLGALHDVNPHTLAHTLAPANTQLQNLITTTLLQDDPTDTHSPFTIQPTTSNPTTFSHSSIPSHTRIINIIHNNIHTLLTPRGHILWQTPIQPHSTPQYFIKFYPYIDGEIHSLVDDVIEQQRYVNRLISLLDQIIASSAKGVLLYPADQLPDGFSWRDIRRIWSNPQGILPFKRTSRSTTPSQVTATQTGGAGATEMLKTQLQLFDEITGVSNLIRSGSHNAQGEGMLRTQMEYSNIAVYDILDSFKTYTRLRNTSLARVTQNSELGTRNSF